jgi:hypothetical protein
MRFLVALATFFSHKTGPKITRLGYRQVIPSLFIFKKVRGVFISKHLAHDGLILDRHEFFIFGKKKEFQ